jgi:hypothetical protein
LPFDSTNPDQSAVTTSLVSLVINTLLILAFSTPLILVERQHGRQPVTRRFLIAGTVIAVVAAGTSVVSNKLVESCILAGNSRCEDVGSIGIRFLTFGTYIIAALITAAVISQD